MYEFKLQSKIKIRHQILITKKCIQQFTVLLLIRLFQYRPEPPEWRLINSLRSCLPNEVNFILNTLLLYCSDHHKGKRLRLERCPHLLDILMLHAGCPKSEVILEIRKIIS